MSRKIRSLKSRDPLKAISKFADLPKIVLAWFDREQYAQLLLVADDPDNLPATFDQWEKKAKIVEQEFNLHTTVSVTKIQINVDELLNWCKNRNYPLDSSARSQYAGEIALKQ